jgi:circadian clock protein KaiC
MSMDRVQIRRLTTGIPGLDKVLGGGLPEFSFNLVAGGPGVGKTTLAQQFMFANATDERPAIYFTIFGEPPIKMLRYQQQFEFFDATKINRAIRFVHLGKELMEGGLVRVLERIERELESAGAGVVVVDSFRSVARKEHGPSEKEREDPRQIGLERFVQLLALSLTSYEATTFLIGEYLHEETESNPVFTVADGILWMYQTVVRNSAVRSIHVMKMRGQESIPGLHTLKLTQRGVHVFPRVAYPEHGRAMLADGEARRRKRTGVPALDEMLRGGIPEGYSVLVIGPPGAGKSMLAAQFVLEGIEQGEPGVIAVFEKRPEEYLKGHSRARRIARCVEDGTLHLLHIRPLDLSVDETLEELTALVARGAKRVVIDSLSGFELALAPAFRDDARESLYRMVGALSGLGVTVLLTVEMTDLFSEVHLRPHGLSFLADGVILQRYVELDGTVGRVMAVIKMRGADHSKDIRPYDVTDDGIVLGPRMNGFHGILAGTPAAGAGTGASTGARAVASKASKRPTRAAKPPEARVRTSRSSKKKTTTRKRPR